MMKNLASHHMFHHVQTTTKKIGVPSCKMNLFSYLFILKIVIDCNYLPTFIVNIINISV